MYQYESRVTYSEVGESGCLTVPHVVDYFQNASLLHSHDVGLSLSVLADKHKAWLVSYWHVVINKLPIMGDRLTLKTWPYAFRAIYGMRNYTMENDAGEVLAYADSHWFLFDFAENKPIRPEESEKALYGQDDRYPMDYQSRKVVCDLADCTLVENIPVKRSHLDTNHHVNNGAYVTVSHNALPDGFEVKQFRVEYRQSAHKGDTFQVYIKPGDTDYYVILTGIDGTIFTITQFMNY